MLSRNILINLSSKKCTQYGCTLENEIFIEEAGSQYGSRGMAQAKELVSQLTGMFAGGELTEEDKVAVMRSLEQAFWLAKEENKKYAPKRFRK